MEIPLLIFWLLLLGAAISVVMMRFRPAFVWATAVGTTSLTLLIWLTVRSQLPLETTFSRWSASGFLPDWTWHIDATVWELSFWLLLLATAVFLHTSLKTNPSSNNSAHLLLLIVAALTAIWSNNLMGFLAGATLLLALLLATLWLAGEQNNAFLFKGAILLLGLLLAWPIGSSSTALLAAVLLLNIWPLPLWHPRTGSGRTDSGRTDSGQTAVSIFTLLLPPLAGGLLLLRLLPVAEFNPGPSLLLTVLALVGFMQAIRLACGRLHLPSYAVAALLLAQAHLLLLSAIWVGSSGVVAELRVLLLAGGTLCLIVAQPNGQRWSRLVSGGLALAALAGLPLTATFASRATLYANWLANGRWALVLVLALLHLPLIMTGVWLLLAKSAESTVVESQDWRHWLREAIPFLPALGLISVNNVIWVNVPLLIWLIIVITAVGGTLLPHFLGDAQQVQVALRQALGAERPFSGKLPSLRQVAESVQTAVNDAADILDGDSGLLWVLLLAVIIIFAS
ncbi:MAG: hypothetical protein GY805_15090 [Chloroflexi bacterium]|nr:hypothetical protein [Chloroflexota bacterium]